MNNNRICKLFNIHYPVIQAGMVWCSGWELAAAVSNAGGLGIIGSGSMYPEMLRENIRKCKAATSNAFAVNVPLLYPQIEAHMHIIAEEKVPIVFSSAGNPKTWTSWLKERGIISVHVVSSTKFALKAQEAGVDAVVAEGFEAGGHNGREETTTFCLIPLVKKVLSIPLIAAGGIGNGAGMLAAMALGADAVQIGSRFVASIESSAHQNFKNMVLGAKEGDTSLELKKLTPVRLMHNAFYDEIKRAEQAGASAEELRTLLGKGRAKKGMYEGDLDNGELEIGQVSALFEQVKPAGEIIEELLQEFNNEKKRLSNMPEW